jgi:hypothetical protein
MSNDYTNKLTYGVSGKRNGMIFYSPREGSHTVPVAGTKLTSVHPARRLVTGTNPATTTVVGVGSNVVANISSINFKVTTGSLQPGFAIQSATLNGIPNTLAMFGGSGYVGTGPFLVVGGSGQGLRITATNVGGVLTIPVVVASGAGYVAGETVTVVGGDQNATITILSVTTSQVPNSAGAYVAVVESGFAVIVDASGEPLTMASNNGVAPGTTLVVGDALASSFSRWIPRIPARTSPRVLRVTRTAEWVVELGLSSKVTQSFLDSRPADGAQAGNGFDIPIDLEGVTRFTWQEPSQDLRGAGVQGPRASHIQNQAAAIPSLLAVDELYDASSPEQAIATPPIDTDTQSGSVAIVVTAVDPATGIYTLKTSRADNGGPGNFEYVAGTYNLSFGDVERLVTDITQLTRVPVPGTTPEYDSSGVLTSLHTLEQQRVPGFKPGSIVADVDDFATANQFTLSFAGSVDTSLVFPSGTTAADLAQFPVLVYFQRLGAFTSTTMSSLDLSLMSAGRNVTVDVSRGGVFPNYGGSGFLLPHANIFSNYHYLDVGPDTAENARDLFAAIFGQIPMDVERSKMIDFNILQKEGYVIDRTADSQRETAVAVDRLGPVRGVTHVALGNSTGKIQTQTGISKDDGGTPHVPTSLSNAVIRAPTVNIGLYQNVAPNVVEDGDYFAPSPLACTSNYVSFSKGLGASSSFIQVRIITININAVQFLAPTGSVVTGTGIDLTQPPYQFPALPNPFNPGTNQTISAVEQPSSILSGGNLQSSGLSLFTMALANATGLNVKSDVVRVASPRNQDFVYLAGLEGEIMYGPGTGDFTYIEPSMFGGNQPTQDSYNAGNRPARVEETQIYPTSLNVANPTGRTQYRAKVLCEWTPASVPETTGRMNFSIVTKGVRA